MPIKGRAEIDTSKCERRVLFLSSTGQRLRIQRIELPEVKGEEVRSCEGGEGVKDFFEKFPIWARGRSFKGDSEKSMEGQIIDTVEKRWRGIRRRRSRPTNRFWARMRTGRMYVR